MFYECPRPSRSHALKSPGEPRWGSRKTYVIHPGCARFARDPGLCWLTPSEFGCMAQQILTEIGWQKSQISNDFQQPTTGVRGEREIKAANANLANFKRH